MKRTLTTALTLMTVLCALAWGQKGHDVTAAMAQRHLTPAARHLTDSLLDNRTIIYWANWLDNASNTPQYKHTKTWHYKNVNQGVRYEDMAPLATGDAVRAIKDLMKTLQDPGTTPDDKPTALKMLVHIVGDIHCPMHMGRATDRGGNQHRLKYFGNDTNLHSLWDSALPEAAHKWSYTEWCDQLDAMTPADTNAILYPAGYDPALGLTPMLVDEWAKETVTITNQIYDRMPQGADVRYDDIAWAAPIIEQQLQRAGLRLALILNTIAQ